MLAEQGGELGGGDGVRRGRRVLKDEPALDAAEAVGCAAVPGRAGGRAIAAVAVEVDDVVAAGVAAQVRLELREGGRAQHVHAHRQAAGLHLFHQRAGQGVVADVVLAAGAGDDQQDVVVQELLQVPGEVREQVAVRPARHLHLVRGGQLGLGAGLAVGAQDPGAVVGAVAGDEGVHRWASLCSAVLGGIGCFGAVMIDVGGEGGGELAERGWVDDAVLGAGEQADALPAAVGRPPGLAKARGAKQGDLQRPAADGRIEAGGQHPAAEAVAEDADRRALCTAAAPRRRGADGSPCLAMPRAGSRALSRRQTARRGLASSAASPAKSLGHW